MNQDQDKTKKKKKKTVAPVILKSVDQTRLHCRHLVRLIIKGSNFRKATLDIIDCDAGEIVERELITPRQIDLTIRVKTVTRFTKGKITIAEIADQKAQQLDLLLVPPLITNMSVIPAGKFIFGDNRTSPGKEVELKEFSCALFETTNKEYMDFLNFIAEQGDHSFCHPDEPDDKSHIPDFFEDEVRHHPGKPVTGIDWYDAYAYASWRGYRLPTREEWEKAARGTQGWQYPWGDKPRRKTANTSDSGTALFYVSYFANGISPYGIYNTVGNAWEWTDSHDGNEKSAIIKGGSFKTPLVQALTHSFNKVDKFTRREDIGFRCVADIDESVWKALNKAWLLEEKKLKASELEKKKAEELLKEKATETEATEVKPQAKRKKARNKKDRARKKKKKTEVK